MAKHPHPHHPATPATPTPPPAPQWTPLNWSFPFAPKSGNPADPQTWLHALAGADGGFYPLGSNGMFHGGIHFDAGTGSDLKLSDGVRAIADGEVVAYRLNSKYPELTYPTTPPRYALYSTGFVLVRHKLVLPPAPTPAGSSADMPRESVPAAAPAAASGAQTPQTYQAPADEVLEFYSLYMHQLDLEGYQAAEQTSGGNAQSAPSIRRLPFWQGDRHFQVGAKASDRQAAPPQLNTPLEFSQPNSGLRVAALDGGALLGGVASGPALDSLDTLSQYIDRVRYTVSPTALTEAAEDTDTPQTGIDIRDLAHGKVIGLLPRGGELSIFGDASKGWAQIATITKGTPIAAVAGGTPDPRAATGWVNLDQLDATIDPKPLDTVVVLDTPYKVAAGDVVGYLGEYQNSSEASMLPPKPSRPLLHVEVFTGAQINDFIEKSRERAKKLPDSGKTLLVIRHGAKLVKATDPDSKSRIAGLTLAPVRGDPGKGVWAKVQPTQPARQSDGHGHGNHSSGTPVGSPLWVERRFVGKAARAIEHTWADFPLQFAHAQVPAVGYQQVLSGAQLDGMPDYSKAMDDKGTQWWSIAAGSDDGRTITGWLCKTDHPDTVWESPWAWPGFDSVDTTSIPLLDMWRRCLFQKKALLDGEEKEFSAVAATVNASPFIAKLEKAAKRQSAGEGNVVPADLRKVLTVPWLAEAVSHLIFRYESEWGGDIGKWTKFLSFMGDGKHIWQAEMERIEKLAWWDKVSAVKGFPASADVWHIHPIGIVGNFYKSGTSLDELIRRIGDIISGGEGGYESYNTGTDGPHGAVGHSYMKRPKGTVTGKTINEILATEHLSYTDPARFYTTGKYQTIIPTLREGKAKLGITGEDKYDEDMQERMFSDFLLHHAGGGILAKFVKQGIGAVDEAQYAASKEWASIAAPAGYKIKDGRESDGTLSYYEGRNNHAYMPSTNKLKAILVQISQSR